MVEPLSDAITLRKLEIKQEEALAAPVVVKRPGPPDEAAAAKEELPLAQRTLKKLRAPLDDAPLTATLEGISRESAALHVYLGKLAESDWFSAVELKSIERLEDSQAEGFRFAVRLVVQPGYGHPKTPPLKRALATHKDPQKPAGSYAMKRKPTRGSWLVTVPLAAITVAFLMLLFLPGQRRIEALHADLRVKQDFVFGAGQMAVRIHTLDAELAETRKYNETWRLRSSDSAAVTALCGRIAQLAQDSGVSTSRFAPGRRKKQSVCSEFRSTWSVTVLSHISSLFWLPWKPCRNASG